MSIIVYFYTFIVHGINGDVTQYRHEDEVMTLTGRVKITDTSFSDFIFSIQV